MHKHSSSLRLRAGLTSTWKSISQPQAPPHIHLCIILQIRGFIKNQNAATPSHSKTQVVRLRFAIQLLIDSSYAVIASRAMRVISDKVCAKRQVTHSFQFESSMHRYRIKITNTKETHLEAGRRNWVAGSRPAQAAVQRLTDE